jgi:hypothetical protein
MKEHVKKTFNANVLTGLGSFGSLFKLDLTGIKEPVLVAGTDGVGTKLKIAFLTDKHDTVGQDCVAMCVNDILCQGAKPLFFLDYIATGKVKAENVAEIVKGVADGCVRCNRDCRFRHHFLDSDGLDQRTGCFPTKSQRYDQCRAKQIALTENAHDLAVFDHRHVANAAEIHDCIRDIERFVAV